MLTKFLTWMEAHYDIDYEQNALRNNATRTIIQREVPPEHTPSPKKVGNQRSLQYPVLPQKCAAGCFYFSTRGTNASHIKMTSTVCGHSMAEARKREPKFDMETCPHDNTDIRGSDRVTHRVYCLDCCRYLT